LSGGGGVFVSFALPDPFHPFPILTRLQLGTRSDSFFSVLMWFRALSRNPTKTVVDLHCLDVQFPPLFLPKKTRCRHALPLLCGPVVAF